MQSPRQAEETQKGATKQGRIFKGNSTQFLLSKQYRNEDAACLRNLHFEFCNTVLNSHNVYKNAHTTWIKM